MRRLRRPSSITMKLAIWPFPSTSFHVRPFAEAHARQCCRMRRLSLTASQKSLLNASATGISFGIVSLRTPSDPAAVDRVLAADELDIRRLARRIDVERPPECRDDLGRFAHPLG